MDLPHWLVKMENKFGVFAPVVLFPLFMGYIAYCIIEDIFS